MIYCNICKKELGFLKMGISVYFHNARYAGGYSRLNTPVYGGALLEFHAFAEQPNLLIWCLSVAVE